MISIVSLRSTPTGAKSMLLWGATLVALLPLLWLLLHGQMNLMATLLIFLVLLVTTVISKPVSICTTLVYLFVMGDIRRLFGWLFGFPKLDPLLIVGPLISIILAVPLLMDLRLKDALSKGVFGLMVIMMLEILNPRQGPVIVGITGAMFYLVPLMWFWIGRAYCTEGLLSAVLYKVLIPIGVAAALLGLTQTFVGFLPWESAWIDSVKDHLHALNLGGGFIRSFGFFCSGVEYINVLLVSLACTIAVAFSGRRIYLILIPLLAAALFLSSSRSAIVKLLFAAAASWALSSKGGRGWTVRLVIALAVGIGVLSFSLSRFSEPDPKAAPRTAAGMSSQHELSGLQHPLDRKYSTAGAHSQMFLNGIAQGFRFPIGNGLGSTTLGAGKFGGDESATGSSEVDISDAFTSLGAIGGLFYCFIVILTLRRLVSFTRSGPKYLALPLAGILFSMVGAWIAAGQYAVVPMTWFVIGFLSRPNVKRASRGIHTRH